VNDQTYDQSSIDKILKDPAVRAALALWGGRRRVLDAAKTVFTLIYAYRALNNKASSMDKEERKKQYSALHEKSAKDFADMCKRNGATWAKLAQIMSSRPDILPRAYITELKTLQNDNPPLPFAKMLPTIKEALGHDWEQKIPVVIEKPIATASIAQVHKAQLADGRWVAIKVRIPKVGRLFKQDFTVLRVAAPFINRQVKQVDVQPMMKSLMEAIERELDFTIEAESMKKFSEFTHVQGIRSPVLVEELSSEKIIVSEWIEGDRLSTRLDNSDKEACRQLLQLISQSYVQQMLQFGFFQADPHAGNFIVDADDNIWVLDFGNVGELTANERMKYMVLFAQLTSGQTENLAQLLMDAGFEGIDEKVIADLEAFEKKARANRRAGRGRKGMGEAVQELTEQLQNLHVKVPDNFVAMGRVFGTIGGLFNKYRVPIPTAPV